MYESIIIYIHFFLVKKYLNYIIKTRYYIKYDVIINNMTYKKKFLENV